MKRITCTSIFFLLALALTAQVPAGFSYQAVVRDNSGEIVANRTVKFRFTLLQNSATGTPVYVETQSKATNAFGLANLVVGTGTKVSGSFNPSGWGDHSHFLKVELDPDNGATFSHLGTVQLMAVPYAFHAQTVEELSDQAVTEAKIAAGAVTGSKIAQAGALAGQALKWTGTTWAPADDLEGAGGGAWQISGDHVYRLTGNVGIGTNAPTSQLHVHGTAAGRGNVVFVGEANTSNPGDPPVSGAGTRMMWYPDKGAFRAGYGGGTRWDKENTGNFSVAIGYSPLASGTSSIALGASPTASGGHSVAFGYMPTASGANSIAMGNLSEASGQWSIAMGNYAVASGANSIATGKETFALGDNSATIGQLVRAYSFCETAIGYRNTGYTPQSINGWDLNDRLFVIGNGGTTASNAMTVLKSGNTGIGTDTPQARLHIRGDGFPSSFLYIEAGVGNDAGIRFYEGKTDRWHIFNNSAAAGLQIYNKEGQTAIFAKQDGALVGIGVTNPTQVLDVGGNARIRAIGSGAYAGVVNRMSDGTLTTTTSDIRMKENIRPLQNSLDRVMQLRGVSFTWKNDPAMGRRIGFIAQEFEGVLPELVFTNEADGFKGINYAEVTAVLTEAIKEQQQIINSLKTENDWLKSEVIRINREHETRLSRLEGLR